MNPHKRQQATGMVKLDPAKVHHYLQQVGQSKSHFAERTANIRRATFNKALRGELVRVDTAEAIARGFRVSLDALRSVETGSPIDTFRFPEHPEYEIVAGSISPIMQTSNGLRVRTCQLAHRQLAGEFARGKLYELIGLADSDRAHINEKLKRHPKVCRQLGRCALIPENLSVLSVANGDGWWVVDRWFSDRLLSETRVAKCVVPQIAKSLLAALGDLHAQEIILRELAPSRILITENHGELMIADLELAQMTKADATVSTDWLSIDPYRAPEIASGEPRPQSDFFSWGQLVFELLAEQLPKNEPIGPQVTQLGLTKKVSLVLEACLSLDWTRRPGSAAEIERALRRWN